MILEKTVELTAKQIIVLVKFISIFCEKNSMKFGIGQSIKRIEDNNLVTGQGQFSDDKLPGEGCHVAFLRSPFAHADITDIDISDAGAADGVILAATQAELDNDKVGEIKCMQYV